MGVNGECLHYPFPHSLRPLPHPLTPLPSSAVLTVGVDEQLGRELVDGVLGDGAVGGHNGRVGALREDHHTGTGPAALGLSGQLEGDLAEVAAVALHTQNRGGERERRQEVGGLGGAVGAPPHTTPQIKTAAGLPSPGNGLLNRMYMCPCVCKTSQY